MRIIFAGTPDFAVPALDSLAAAGHELVAVYTQPDRAAGRGRKLQPSPVKRRAQELGVAIEQPADLTGHDAVERLASYRPELMVVVAYGLILPQAVLDLPRLGCVNIHASLLPRWRGAAPIQRAIEAGDAESGVSIMQMEAGLDTGPVLLTRATPITPDDTGASLHDRLAALGAEAVVEAIAGLAAGTLQAKPQPASGVTYAAKLSKSEARIDWQAPAVAIERRVRAFNAWPVAWTELAGAALRIWAGQVLTGGSSARPGTVISADARGIDVATGDGVFRITRLQRAGGRPLDAAAFLNAHGVLGEVLK
jgi:methionyl-tRNA formyltransferase